MSARDADVALHEAGHAWAFWRLGGLVKNVSVITRNRSAEAGSGADDPHNSATFSPRLGECSGSFGGSDGGAITTPADVENAWKRVLALFAGGSCDGSAEGCVDDMRAVIFMLGWPALKRPDLAADAAHILSTSDSYHLPDADVLAFFGRHQQSFADIFDETARQAIRALADVIMSRHAVTGRDAVRIFEGIYGHDLPAGVKSSDAHGHTLPDRDNNPVDVIREAIDHLQLLRQRLEGVHSEDRADNRADVARASIVRSIFDLSFLLG